MSFYWQPKSLVRCDVINEGIFQKIADVTDKLIETVAEDNVAEPNLKSVKFSRIYFCFEK